MTGPSRVAETHVSYVVMLGDRAYKLKKPVKTGFLDFSSERARGRACRREVELNRRIAPDVYLGVDTVVDEFGRPRDHLVVMRRMRDEDRLSRALAEGRDVDAGLRALAHQIAAFHSRAATGPRIAAVASREAVRAHWEENFDEMRPFVGAVLPEADAGRVAELARRYLDGRAVLLVERARAGLARDGHGDLLADDIFLTDDGPRVLDCLEFDDELRWGDVLADVAFLAMDLERLGHPATGRRFLDLYRELSGWGWPASLEHHYMAYRAHVRSKVACLRHAQGGAGAAVEARALHDLCLRHLVRGRVRLILVGGAPGTGKSTLAAGIADREGFALLRSDEVRKEVAGVGHLTSLRDEYGTGAYAPARTAATYRALLDRAEAALSRGETVVLDASWSDAARRAAAAHVARGAAAELVQIRCVAPDALADARIAARAGDASDAYPGVAKTMRAGFHRWPEATVLDTTTPLETALAAATRLVR